MQKLGKPGAMNNSWRTITLYSWCISELPFDFLRQMTLFAAARVGSGRAGPGAPTAPRGRWREAGGAPEATRGAEAVEWGEGGPARR